MTGAPAPGCWGAVGRTFPGQVKRLPQPPFKKQDLGSQRSPRGIWISAHPANVPFTPGHWECSPSWVFRSPLNCHFSRFRTLEPGER